MTECQTQRLQDQVAELQEENARLRRLVAFSLREMEQASPYKHSPWCNGVHADNGMCEGDALHDLLEDELRAALGDSR